MHATCHKIILQWQRYLGDYYSNSDRLKVNWVFSRHLELEVIPARLKKAQSLIVKRWDKSPHVGHLRAHKEEYAQTIEKFLKQCKLL